MPNEATVTRLLAGRSEVRIPMGANSFPLRNVYTGTGSHPVSFSMATAFFAGIKRPERDVDLSPRLSAEDKCERIHTSIPPTYLQGHLSFLCPNFRLDCFRMGLTEGTFHCSDAVTEYQLTQLIMSCINSTRVNVYCVPERRRSIY
jgi:hypothetical protein